MDLFMRIIKTKEAESIPENRQPNKISCITEP